MQLDDLKKPMDEMSDEELRALLSDVRRRREIVREKARKEPKGTQPKKSSIEKLTKEQILARLKEMGVA